MKEHIDDGDLFELNIGGGGGGSPVDVKLCDTNKDLFDIMNEDDC